MALRQSSIILLVTVSITLVAAHSQAAIDPVKINLLGGNNVPLSWNSIDDSQELRREVSSHEDKKGYTVFTFTPGQYILFRIPSHSIIRMFNPSGTFLDTPLSVSTSYGNGLFIDRPIQHNTDSTSLFVTPDLRNTGLARIKLLEHAESPVSIALSTSYYETVGTPAAYLQSMPLTAPKVQLSKRPYESSQTFHILDANRPTQVRVRGPAHYSLEQRLLFSGEDQDSRVDYTITGLLGTAHYLDLMVTTEPENHQLVKVDGTYPLVSRSENSYFFVPDGEHILTLVPTQTLYARLSKKKQSNFLLPAQNDPIFKQDNPPAMRSEIVKNLYPFKNSSALSSTLSVDKVDRYSNLLWQDNRFSDGGLASAMAISGLAASFPALSEVRRHSTRIAGAHSFFRDIVPQSDTAPVLQHFFTIVSPALKDDISRQFVIHPNTATLLSRKKLKEMRFSELQSNRAGINSKTALQFNLPKRQTPSEIKLHVILDQDSKSFGITVGNGPQIICELLPETVRPPNEFKVTGYKAARLLTPSVVLDQTARRVGTIILPLKQSEDTVTLHRLDDSQESVLVALQFRDSRPFNLEEHQYLKRVIELGGYNAAFKLATVLLGDDELATEALGQTLPEAELSALYRPLIRLIKTLDTDYVSSVYPLSEKFRESELHSIETINDTRTLLKKAQETQQWIQVIEHSSYLLKATRGETRRAAAEQMIIGLLNTGEHYLAELHLKGMFLFPDGSDKSLASWAQSRLEQLYQAENDLRRLASLYAVALTRNPTSDLFNEFSRILFKQGKYGLALRAALIPPPGKRSADTILKTSLAVGWLHTFESTLNTVSDENIRSLWLGLEKIKQDDMVGAREMFAGQETDQRYLQLLNEADDIQADLQSPELSKRLKAINRWEQWQQNQPGPSVWKSESQNIYQHAGGALLYSAAQDLQMLMYRSDNDRPVRFRVWGPVTISTTIRPLHSAEDTAPVNGWARMEDGREQYLIPITNNLPNQQWQLPNNEHLIPGMTTQYQRYLGPGLHDISISSDTIPLLVSLQILRPAFDDLGLPLLSHKIVEAAFQDKVEPGNPEPVSRFSCFNEDCVALLPELPTGKPRFFPAELFSLEVTQPSVAPSIGGSPIDRVSSYRQREPEHTVKTVARLMAQGKYHEALANADISSADERDQTLNLLTYLAEKETDRCIHYEAKAQDILSRYPDSPEYSSLLRRISADSRWEQVPFIQGSAGLRMLPYQTWRPEEPALRIRKSLLRQQPQGQTVLTGRDSAVLAMSNVENTTLKVSFTLAELPYLKPESMSVAYQLDDNPPDVVHLSPDISQEFITLSVPKGNHRLAVSILERYTNQYLWVHFEENAFAHGPHNLSSSLWSTHHQERSFHVVSRDEPLVAMVPGPAWVRVDELSNGLISSTYHYIDSDAEPVEIRSGDNSGERLVRIFYRVADRSIDGDHLMRTAIKNYQKVLPPMLEQIDVRLNPYEKMLADLPPPLPELDESYSATLSYHRRRDLQEDSVSDDPETFVQLAAKYQTFYESVHAYLQSSLFIRRRTIGGPTVGITGDYSWHNRQLPVTLRIQGELLAQNPDGSSLAAFNWNPLEWTAKLKFTAYQYRPITPQLTHRPMISIFARLLSTDTADDYREGSLDQDIFTPYKADHKLGMQLSEYLSYRPWLDTQFNARAVFALNEDFNPLQPDHLRLAVGWRQLLGQYQLSTGYQFTRFFEDEDRSDIIDRNDLSLAALWDPLFNVDNWLRLHFRYRFQIDTREHTGMLGFTWYFGGNRAIFHQRPEDDPFNAIRRIRTTMRNYNRVSK